MISIEFLYEVYTRHPQICTDSRHLQPGDIFFALHGANFDGNDFAAKALELGASYAVIDRNIHPDDRRFLHVEDTLTALQQLAAYHRMQCDIPVISLTGTNGKTTTKELIRSVLSRKYNLLATEGNLNNHIGVPLTILKIKAEHELALIEMGAGAPGEISLLTGISKPTVGLITNIGLAHLQGFGSIEGVLRTKNELPDYLYAHDGVFLLNSDDPLLLKSWSDRNPLSYGASGSFLSGQVIGHLPYLSAEIEGHKVSTHLVGAYNLSNILAAAAVGKYFDIPMEEICKGIESYVPTNNRSQLISRPGGAQLIVDAYNANPSSMAAAIANLASTPAKHRVAILGDMLELGEASHTEHIKILELLGKHPEIEPLLCGQHFRRAAEGRGLRTFDTSAEVASYLSSHPLPCDTLALIKGSRGIALERILDTL